MDKLKRLENLLELANQDYIKTDDFGQVVETFVKIVKELKAHFEKEMSQKHEMSMNECERMMYEMKDMELRMEKMVTESKQVSMADVRTLAGRLNSDIERVRELIPSPQDLSFIERKIEEVEKKIPVIKDIRDTPEEVRDKLERLKNDERLDISAIKGIGKRLTKLSDDIINRAIGILDQRTSFLINKLSNFTVKSIIAGSNITITDNGDGSYTIASTASGGGATVETPTGTVDGSNTSFTVTAEPDYVVADGITYFDGAGYTYAALTITMDQAPNIYIRAFV